MTACFHVIGRGAFGIGVELSLDRRHQVLFKVLIEHSQLTDGAVVIIRGACAVKRRRNNERRLNIAFFYHIVDKLPETAVLKKVACMTSSAVHQIDDIIAGIGIISVVTVWQIYISGLCNGAFITDIVAALVVYLNDLALLFCRFEVFSWNGRSHSCLFEFPNSIYL